MAVTLRHLILAFFLVGLGPANSQAPPPYALLETGSFHGDEVSLKQPRDWVGIFCKQGACEARPMMIHTARVHDEVVDEDSKANTGTSVTVSAPEQPLFLVRGVNATPRKIPAWFVGEEGLDAGDSFHGGFPSAGYALQVEGKKTEDEPLPKGSRLVFSHGSESQELFSLPKGGNDSYITVLWVGDLDGDGKPDLLVVTSWHYNVSHKVLWLSSLAKPGQLVGLAAILETTGC